mgnify:CR=1 FL=1
MYNEQLETEQTYYQIQTLQNQSVTLLKKGNIDQHLKVEQQIKELEELI